MRRINGEQGVREDEPLKIRATQHVEHEQISRAFLTYRHLDVASEDILELKGTFNVSGW